MAAEEGKSCLSAVAHLRSLGWRRNSNVMRNVPGLLLLVLLMLTTGCTRALIIALTFDAGLPIATFRMAGPFSRPLDSVCIWSAEIVDNATGARIAELRSRRFDDDCARVSKVSFSHPDPALTWVGVSHSLAAGQAYRVDVTADGSVGRSDPWQKK